jgi:lipopolysaccharide heptosyltransferase II
MQQGQLENGFTLHAPTPDQQARYRTNQDLLDELLYEGVSDAVANTVHPEPPGLDAPQHYLSSGQSTAKASLAVRRKALIVKFGQIGDVIMAVPAARALYERGFDIDWVCGRAVYPLLACYSWIRPIEVDDKSILRGSLRRRIGAVLHLWHRTVLTGYDLCANLYYDRRFRLLTMPIRATRKLALQNDKRSALLIAGRHHTDEFVRLLLDAEDTCRQQSTSPVSPDRLVPSPLPVTSAQRRIAIFPGGTSNVLGEQVLRRWPVQSYVSVAERLLTRGWQVLLLGGPEDLWVRSHFASMPVVDCLGSLTLPQVLSVCNTSDAVITHDTGPLHLAGLSSACLIGIFGPTDPATRVPRRPFALGIWGGEGFACRPCYDGKDFAPCRFNGCMHQVSPERTVFELDRLLAAKGRAESEPWKVVSLHA